MTLGVPFRFTRPQVHSQHWAGNGVRRDDSIKRAVHHLTRRDCPVTFGAMKFKLVPALILLPPVTLYA
jgi:hypothetical protein